MKKSRIALLMLCVFWGLNFSYVHAEQNPNILIQIENCPDTVNPGALFTAEIQIANIEEEFSCFAHWLYNDTVIDGYENKDFLVVNNKKSKLTFLVPTGTKLDSTLKIGFELLNGDQIYKVEKIIAVPSDTTNEERVLSTIKQVEIEAIVIEDTAVYADMLLTDKIGSITAGSKAVYFNYYEKISAELYLNDGTTGWVSSNTIDISDRNYTIYDDFSNDDKELFVNIKEYTSDTDYLVWINLERQKVNVFLGKKGSWKIERIMTCASGENETPTISGVFRYSQLVPRWDFDEYYVKPVMVFNGGHAMHSRTYNPDGTLYGIGMGQPLSHGCVRMLQEDIDWQAYYIPIGTTVVVY